MRMTLAEYQNYLAKQRHLPAPEIPERKLHAQILAHCRAYEWLAFHGSMAHATFRTEGEPDFIILLPGGQTCLVECKSRTGKMSNQQLAVQAWAARLGHTLHVVRTFDEFLIAVAPVNIQPIPTL